MPPTHALQRGLNKLAFGVVRDMHAAASKRAPNLRQEGEQQFQIPVSGKAGVSPEWVTKDLKFHWTFYGEAGQRDSELNAPQVSFGVVMDSREPIFAMPCVMKWDRKDADEIEGATVAIAVWDPTGRGVKFKGSLHVTFQGYGAPAEYEAEDIE